MREPHIAAACILAAACSTTPQLETRESERPPLVVSRGELDQRVILTGELDAADSTDLAVPRTSGWQVSIRYLGEDGEPVKKGERVMELDNSAIVQSLQELELQVIRASNALVSQRAADAIKLADAELEVERQRVAKEKAEIDAAIPPTLIARRTWQQNQLALERARTAHTSAVEALETARESAALEEKVKRIDLEKARRALERAEAQLDAVFVKAPHDGILLVSDHPWFGRQLQVGDVVRPGMSAAKVSSSATLEIVAQLSDVDDGRIATGMRADCVLDAYPDEVFAGTITAISTIARQPEKDSPRRFFEVEVELDETDTEVMRPGLSARVEVKARSIENALLAPRAGLDLEARPPRALLADGGAVDVGIEACTAQACAVTSGLDDGDRLRYLTRAP